jgi:hypothetical protein
LLSQSQIEYAVPAESGSPPHNSKRERWFLRDQTHSARKSLDGCGHGLFSGSRFQ